MPLRCAKGRPRGRGGASGRQAVPRGRGAARGRAAPVRVATKARVAREARKQSPVREDPMFDDVEEEAVPEIGGEEVDQTVPPVAQPAPPAVVAVSQIPGMTKFFQ